MTRSTAPPWRAFLDERYAPITSSIGLLAVSVELAADALSNWRVECGHGSRLRHLCEPVPDALARLEPLTSAVRPRELLVQVRGNWCAYFDCGGWAPTRTRWSATSPVGCGATG